MSAVSQFGRHPWSVLFVVVCLVSTTRAIAADCSPATSGLIGWWPGDGNATDIAGTNNGILQGGATATAAGLAGPAFRFDGTNNYVQIPDSPGLRPTNLTVEAWVFFTGLDSAGSGPAVGSQYIIFKQNTRSGGFEGFSLNKIRVTGQDHFAFQVTSAAGLNVAVASSTLVTTGAWYHVAGVRGSNYLQLYVNGNLQGQSSVSFPQDYGNFPLYFGTSGQNSWDRRLKGILDEASLYNRALSSNEIVAIYTAGAAGKCKAPDITVPPQSQNVAVGSNVTFTVSATGFGTLSYQWKFNTTNIAGATGTNFVLNNVQPANAGNYTVTVTNKLGSATSTIAVLTVGAPPTITAQPQGLTNVAGTTATFTVAVNGTPPFTYQWLKNATNVLNGGKISGANTPTLTISNVLAVDRGAYTVIITNAVGPVTSIAVTLGVIDPAIITQPVGSAVTAGDAATFTVAAVGTAPLSYQWRFNATNISGATGTNLTLTGVQLTNAGDYTVVVTNAAGSVTSSMATLTVAVPALIPDANLKAALSSALGKCNFNTLDLLALTNLFAYNANITSLSGLEAATNLRTLHVGNNSISDLTPLHNLARLTTVFLYNNHLADLSPLAGLTNLSYLEVRWNAVTNFEAVLPALTNLKDLYLGGNAISNAAFLQNLSRLTFLDLDGNWIDDASPLAALTNLSGLDLGHNPLTNFAQLAVFTNLTSLYLSGNSISNLSFLANLTRLTELAVCSNQLTELLPLAALPNLNTLNLARNPTITNYSALSGLAHMTNLWLSDNSISNAAFLPSLSQLACLNLDNNFVSTLAPLAAMTQLNFLSLTHNPITDCAPLSGLTNLQALSLGGGQAVSNLAFLAGLTRLTFLDLDRNQISDVSPLAGLTNLGRLDLSWNPITNYAAPLAGLANLCALQLEGDSISDLTFLANLTRLTFLNLGNNRIADLSPLAGLTNLGSLRLQQNRLADIGSLAVLPKLSSVNLDLNLLDLSPGAPAVGLIHALESQCQRVAVDYQPQRGSPEIKMLTVTVQGNWYIAANATTYLRFSISDSGPAGQKPGVGASSSNNNLVSDASLVPSQDSNGDWLVPVTPTANQPNTAGITLTVTNDVGLSTNLTVAVTVIVPQAVDIPDPNLGTAIRMALGNPVGAITSLDMLSLTYLAAYNITNATGLAGATNLTYLRLTGTGISNLALLQNLNKLTTLTILDIGGGPLSGLSGLTNLTGLFLDSDSLTDLSFLQNLVGLKYLILGNNQITDLSPLTGLTNIEILYVQGNRLTNIQPLQNLSRLSYVTVQFNLLDTATNSAAAAVIQSLRNRGVYVDDLPQGGPPSISAPGTWTITANSPSALVFGAADAGSANNPLNFAVHSSNPDLVPDAKISINQVSGVFFLNLWTLKVIPALNQTGSTMITVSVTNTIGLSTNTYILVTVASPVPLDGQFLNYSNLAWQTSANAPWFGETAVTHDGISAAQSGVLADGGQSWLETTFPGPGMLSFWWKVSSETNDDNLSFSINGTPQPAVISGEENWQQQTVLLQPGAQTLRWQYSKDPASSFGADAAWLDQVAFAPASWLELTTRPAGNQCQLVLHPVMGRLYEVLASTNLANWFSLGVITPTNTTMPFLHTNINSSACFYRLREVAAADIWFEQPKLAGNTIQLVLHSPAGGRLEMQTSTNLTGWSALAVITNVLGTVQYTNALPVNSPKSFYRARQLP